jgi:hypothetical protein
MSASANADIARLAQFGEQVGVLPMRPTAFPILQLANQKPDPAATLLGDRWLCRGGAAIIAGPSGIGKSSASMQQDLCWAVGREAFGITPAGALKVLTIQAENDEGDLCEMVQGVKSAIGFTKDEEQTLLSNVHYAFEQQRTGACFVKEVVRPLLEEYHPDLLRIDPLQAFCGADITQAKESALFLRNGLNPLLSEFQCGLILMHHTPKQNSKKDNSKNRTSDWMYAGAGSADIVNWSRGILIIDPAKQNGCYRFVAAKRGSRIGWKNSAGEKQIQRWFKWGSGSICWEDAEPELEARNRKDDVGYVLSFVPLKGSVTKNRLIHEANIGLDGVGLGKQRVRETISLLVDEGLLTVEKVPRSGTNPEVRLSRSKKVDPKVHPQTVELASSL